RRRHTRFSRDWSSDVCSSDLSAAGSGAAGPGGGAPSAAGLRRVLRRARDGMVLNVDEAAIAMTARGEALADLCASAARVRDAGLDRKSVAEGKGGGDGCGRGA